MKKILLLLGIILLASCDNPNVSNTKDDIFWNSRKHQYDYGVTEQTYKEHNYIFFKEGYRMGVVHDPECPKCYEFFD